MKCTHLSKLRTHCNHQFSGAVKRNLRHTEDTLICIKRPSRYRQFHITINRACEGSYPQFVQEPPHRSNRCHRSSSLEIQIPSIGLDCPRDNNPTVVISETSRPYPAAYLGWRGYEVLRRKGSR